MRPRDRHTIWPVDMADLARPRLPAIMALETAVLQERLDAELSQQQKRVLILLSEGYANKAIAWILGIEDATAKAHVSSILKKLNMTNRTQAALLGQRLLLAHDACEESRPGPAARTPAELRPL